MTKKRTGKGRGISINAPNQGGTSDTNAWKMRIEAQAKVQPAVHEFKPLQSWPAIPHPRQAELDAFRAAPSRWV